MTRTYDRSDYSRPPRRRISAIASDSLCVHARSGAAGGPASTPSNVSAPFQARQEPVEGTIAGDDSVDFLERACLRLDGGASLPVAGKGGLVRLHDIAPRDVAQRRHLSLRLHQHHDAAQHVGAEEEAEVLAIRGWRVSAMW